MDENEIEGTKGFIGRLRLRVPRHPGGLGVLAIGLYTWPWRLSQTLSSTVLL